MLRGTTSAPKAALLLCGCAVALLIAALCVSPRGSSSLLQTISIGGTEYLVVPIASTQTEGDRFGRVPAQKDWNSFSPFQQYKQRRLQRGLRPGRTGLFGPGDLPMPINDWDMYDATPGSNVFFFEHGVPPIPYGMDDYSNPPYTFGIPSFEDPNY